MLDETIITETPPLYCCDGHAGRQVRVLISGNRARRVIHGALNILMGEVLLLPTACPEIHAMDHLFRFVKGRSVSNRP